MHDMQWLQTRSGATAFSLAHNKHTGMFILLTQKQKLLRAIPNF